MFKEKQFQPLKFKELKAGMTMKSIGDHHGKLYAGYVNKANEIQKEVEGADKSKANATYGGAYSEMRRQETFAVNGMKLHEVYFGHLGGDGGDASGKIKELIERDFESYENWKEHFAATAMGARGWVVLAYDWDDKMLHIYAQDTHNVGPIWDASPLLALDMYEHAYWMEFGADKKSYLDAFFANLDWAAVNARVEKMKME